MAEYSNILIAVDFSSGAEIVEAGLALAGDQTTVYLMHVVEPLAGLYNIDELSWQEQIVSLEGVAKKAAKDQLKKLCEPYSIPASQQIIATGKAAREIHCFIDDNNIDLVVLGSHGQHGLQLLLGSTANGVLHGATCDVFCVRVAGSD